MSPLHAARDGGEGGFGAAGLTGVAAAAFIVLAATAVGFSLARKDEVSKAETNAAVDQEERAATAETMSSVKNAAVAMESWGIENGGAYTGACGGAASTTCPAFDHTVTGGPNNRLVANGLELPPGVSVAVLRADSTGYCLQAFHVDLPPGNEVYFASEVGAPSDEPCT